MTSVDDANSSTLLPDTYTVYNNTPDLPESSSTSNSNVTFHIIVSVASITLLFLLSGLLVFFVRKRRSDKLRHHLMPLYNFDPAEEGEDWESELLEEGMNYKIAANGKMRVEMPSPNEEPKLAFHRL